MTSWTEEEKRKTVETVEECGGSVMRTTRKSGYPFGRLSTNGLTSGTHRTRGRRADLGATAARR